MDQIQPEANSHILLFTFGLFSTFSRFSSLSPCHTFILYECDHSDGSRTAALSTLWQSQKYFQYSKLNTRQEQFDMVSDTHSAAVAKCFISSICSIPLPKGWLLIIRLPVRLPFCGDNRNGRKINVAEKSFHVASSKKIKTNFLVHIKSRFHIMRAKKNKRK